MLRCLISISTYLKLLGRVVSRVDGGLVLARVGVQLSAVHLDGLEDEAARCRFLVASVLPLDYALGTFGVGGCNAC